MKLERSLYIKTPDRIHSNFGIEFIGRDSKEAMEFQNWMMINVFGSQLLRDRLKPFFQGGYSSLYEDANSFEIWKYVEFWCDKNDKEVHELILAITDKLSKKFKIEYDVK